MNTTWDMLGYWLATCGIPSDEAEDVSDEYVFDPWRPPPNTEVLRVTLSKEDAGRLAAIVAERTRRHIEAP